MKLLHVSLIITALLISYSVNANDAINRSYELSSSEKKKIAEEFNHYFKSTDAGAMQKLNKNPWAGKRARQNQRVQKVLQVSASFNGCKQYSIQQRRQCFVSGNTPSSCELFYKARLDQCSKYF
jgi:Ni,Fe-hydrogenase I large subunit